jgi:hypothetical protein
MKQRYFVRCDSKDNNKRIILDNEAIGHVAVVYGAHNAEICCSALNKEHRVKVATN